MSDKKKTCFVVTPIGKPESDIRRHIDGILKTAIIPVLGDEYAVEAAHTCFESTSITKQVYQKLYDSDLVIANLTNLNPNVMYELGIRFCFGKPVILIAKEGTALPFDINERRTLFYKDDILGVLELKKELIRVIGSLEFREMDSPIHDALKEVQLFQQTKVIDKDNQINEMLSLIMKKLNLVVDKLSEKNITLKKCNPQSDLFYDNEDFDLDFLEDEARAIDKEFHQEWMEYVEREMEAMNEFENEVTNIP